MEMAVEEIAGGIAAVVLRGRLDAAGAGRIDREMAAVAASRRAVVIDLSQVKALTSLGVRLLLLAAKTVHGKGGRLVVLSPDSNVAAVLSVAGTEEILPVFYDRAAAVAAVAT
jgi:anti-anti-sigma factor